MAVVTATDPDHLDIYGTEEAYLESFAHFTSLIQPGGCLIMKKGIRLVPNVKEGVKYILIQLVTGVIFMPVTYV